MAIDSSTQPAGPGSEMLLPSHAKRAALVVAGASLAAVAALAAAMMTTPGDVTIMAPGVVWLAMFVGALAASHQLFHGRQWAQQALLAFWELLLIGSVCCLLGGILYGEGESWWNWALPGVGKLWYAAVVLVASGAISALLIVAARKESRLRYASVVTSSVAMAIALTLAVNIVAQRDYVRKSVESYGMYRLSDRTRTVIDDLDEPVRLTCAYSSSAEHGAWYGRRTFELLTEMADYARRNGRRIEVLNADTDSRKRDVLSSLESSISAKAAPHIAYLRDFIAASPELIDLLRKQAELWKHLPPGAYVNQWNISAKADALSASADQLEALRSRLASQLGLAPLPGQMQPDRGILPDYAKLADETTASLNLARSTITDIAYQLRRIRALSEVVATNHPGIRDAVNELTAAHRAMLAAVGTPDSPAPQDPKAVMTVFAQHARILTQRAVGLADLLQDLAGGRNNELLNASNAWWVELRDDSGAVGRMSPPVVMLMLAEETNMLAVGIDATVNAATDEFLAEQIAPLRQRAALLSRTFSAASLQILTVVDRLAEVDQLSEMSMDQALRGRLMRGLLTGLDDLLAQADILPPLEDETLAADLARDNIVIIEIGDRIEVVPFEAVWPMKVGADPDERSPQRLFNGNAAISSKLLSMTTEPFATVLVTYYRPAGDVQRSQIEPSDLQELYRRLTESNFEVMFWNVVSPTPALLREGTGDRPVVLLVLPPAPPGIPTAGSAPYFGPDELATIKQVIDNGTPAVFLASYFWPRYTESPYYYRPYLRDEWGIDVRSDYLVVPAIPDEIEPERFTLNYRWLGHMPLSLFSDHPIGEPLTGQRMLWLFCCPIEIESALPDRVSVEPLLAIPAAWSNYTWATSRIRELIDQANRGLIKPDYPQGDLPIPRDDVGMPLAVAATRLALPDSSGGEQATARKDPVRIVVLGVGMALVDGYINVPPPGDDRSRGQTDPPRANADLVINSVYWVVGRDDLIAAGPPRPKPIRVTIVSRIILQLLCVVVLPAAIIALGGLVMIIRRR